MTNNSIKHGTSSGSRKCKPKCEVCSNYLKGMKVARAKKLKEYPELFEGKHGATLYNNYNCRCYICRVDKLREENETLRRARKTSS